jgi:hypothetical protein
VARRVLTDEGWPEARIQAVEHCIRAHRFRGHERPQTLEAQVLFDADKLDVMGAFGAARTIGYALQAGTPIYAVPSLLPRSGETEVTNAQRHEYLFKLRRANGCTPTRRRIGNTATSAVSFSDHRRAPTVALNQNCAGWYHSSGDPTRDRRATLILLTNDDGIRSLIAGGGRGLTAL